MVLREIQRQRRGTVRQSDPTRVGQTEEDTQPDREKETGRRYASGEWCLGRGVRSCSCQGRVQGGTSPRRCQGRYQGQDALAVALGEA